MKKIILTLIIIGELTVVHSQKPIPNTIIDSSLKAEFITAWGDFKNCILKKNISSTLFFFTDSLKQNFDSFEEKNLSEFIINKWFNDSYFIKSIKRGKEEFKVIGKASFQTIIIVQHPKAAGEEGDGRLVYFFRFKKYNKTYKLFDIQIAG